jgi:uncharacterized protein (UPF0210 family)
MTQPTSRRRFLGMLGAAGLMWPAVTRTESPGFRVRTITAGVALRHADDLARVDEALRFLAQAKQAYVARGYEVQTIRIATQPLAEYLPAWQGGAGLEALRAIDRRAVEADVAFSIGPVLTTDEYVAGFGPWAASLVRGTRNLSFTVHVASPGRGVHEQAARSAAEAIAAISRATPGGEGNFRFAATAFCPPGTPFFPAAYHEGEPSFAIGLESPPLRTA